MTRTINAVYEGGVFVPLQSLDGIAEHAQVRLTLETVSPPGNGLVDCVGTLPDEDAAQMRRIVEQEFGRVNLNDW